MGLDIVGRHYPHSPTIQARVSWECGGYNPQRVLWQLGYDQGAVRNRGDTSNSNALVTKGQFIEQEGWRSS